MGTHWVGCGVLVAAVLLMAGCDTAPSADLSPPPAAGPRTLATDVDLPSDVAADSFAGAFVATTAGFREQSEVVQERAEQAAGDPEAIRGVYALLRETALDARQSYGALAPPGPVQDEHQRILQLFDRQVALLDDLLEATDADDTQAVAAAVGALTDLTSDFDAARQAMQVALAQCGAPCTT